MIQRARNILCNRHVKDIEILKDAVIVSLDQNVTDPLVASVKDIMSAYTGQYGNCLLEVEGDKRARLREQDRKDVFKKLQRGSELQRLPDYYNQWVKLSRLHGPQLKCTVNRLDSYIDEANQLITRLYRAPLRRDLRMADYANRIPFAMARAELSNVTDETLENAASLVRKSIDEWYSGKA